MSHQLFPVVVVLVLVGFSAQSETFGQERTVVASDAAVGGKFGYSVAIHGNTIVTGAQAGTNGNGAVYFYDRNSATGPWSQQQKLIDSGGASGDKFGQVVHITNDTLIAGAPDAGDGALFVYGRTTGGGGSSWTLSQKLTTSNAGSSAKFGWSFAWTGNIFVIGARKTNCAFIFSRSGTQWTEQQKLTPSPDNGGNFGYALAAEGDIIVIGAYEAENSKGIAYVFGTDGTEQQTLTASDRSNNDEFGVSIAVVNGFIFVGAPGYPGGGLVGAVYVFEKQMGGGLWIETQIIHPSFFFNGLYFGRSIAVSMQTMIVGAYGKWASSAQPGSSFIFTNNGTAWVERQRLTRGVNGDHFGHSVDISGDARTVVVGTDGVDLGTTYVYTLPVSAGPTKFPTSDPSSTPSISPSSGPSKSPTTTPTRGPSVNPSSANPSVNPSASPSRNPSTTTPSANPSRNPTANPTRNPSQNPTRNPTRNPSQNPTRNPTRNPSSSPTRVPSRLPSTQQTKQPSKPPTRVPSRDPSTPTASPSPAPTLFPHHIIDNAAICVAGVTPKGLGLNGDYTLWDQQFRNSDALRYKSRILSWDPENGQWAIFAGSSAPFQVIMSWRAVSPLSIDPAADAHRVFYVEGVLDTTGTITITDGICSITSLGVQTAQPSKTLETALIIVGAVVGFCLLFMLFGCVYRCGIAHPDNENIIDKTTAEINLGAVTYENTLGMEMHRVGTPQRIERMVSPSSRMDLYHRDSNEDSYSDEGIRTEGAGARMEGEGTTQYETERTTQYETERTNIDACTPTSVSDSTSALSPSLIEHF